MTDELKQILYNIGAWAGGIISAFVIQHYRPKQVREDEHDKNQVATIETQGRTLADAWKMIESQQVEIKHLRDKVRELDNELIKYSRALYRSNKFIREHMPNIEVPDFLLDTDPNISKKKI